MPASPMPDAKPEPRHVDGSRHLVAAAAAVKSEAAGLPAQETGVTNPNNPSNGSA
jgi:hypothetical protein